MNVKLRPPSKPTLAQASQNPTVNLRPVSKVETEIPGAQAFGAVLRPVSKNKTEKSGNEVEDVGLLSPPRFQQSASGEFSTESEDDLELTLKSRNVSSDGETSLEGNAVSIYSTSIKYTKVNIEQLSSNFCSIFVRLESSKKEVLRREKVDFKDVSQHK